MVVEIDYGKCRMCGAYDKPICVDNCPTTAISQRDKEIAVTEFLCEDCGECCVRCPDGAIKIKEVTF
jgi:Fe-S-cluster-containing hydrogenase component 2